MIALNLIPWLFLLLIVKGNEIGADDEGLIIDNSKTKPLTNDEKGLTKYAGVFGGSENDYSQLIFDPSLQAHIRVKRFTE